MVDVSFNNGGGSITIKSNGKTTQIVDFPADDDPLTVDEVECVGHQFTLNNELFRWRKPSAYIVRVSVYANSANDETLSAILEETKHDTEEDQLVDWERLDVEMTILCLKSKDGYESQNKSVVGSSYVTHTFSDGCMLGGTPAVSVDSEGKMKSKRYSFVFGNLKTA